MQDRLKIRVWDKYEKSYWLQSTIEQNIHWLMYPEEYKDANYPPDYVEIEQCVGLKDKNDKLIYECDIFKAEVINSYNGDENLYKTIYGQVSWFDIECCFSFAGYQPSDLFEIEIIGNIHENGDLLENKDESM